VGVGVIEFAAQTCEQSPWPAVEVEETFHAGAGAFPRGLVQQQPAWVAPAQRVRHEHVTAPDRQPQRVKRAQGVRASIEGAVLAEHQRRPVSADVAGRCVAQRGLPDEPAGGQIEQLRGRVVAGPGPVPQPPQKRNVRGALAEHVIAVLEADVDLMDLTSPGGDVVAPQALVDVQLAGDLGDDRARCAGGSSERAEEAHCA